MSRASQRQAARQAGDELDLDYSERAGFLTGRAAALADWAFRKEQTEDRKLFARLWARRERQRRPEHVRARLNAWRARNRSKVHAQQRAQRFRRWRQVAPVYTCAQCGAKWCPVYRPGPRPRKFCGRRCANAWHGQRRTPRNRGIRNMGLSDAIVRALAQLGAATLGEVVEACPGSKRGSVATKLSTMCRDGKAVREGHRYRLTG